MECANCNKTGKLKVCSQCHSEHYCSRDCQKAHWKLHKKACRASNSGTSPAPSAEPKGLTVAVEKPFHKLQSRTWLHDRPEVDVYNLLIDTFRLRLDDDYKFDQSNTEGSIYAGESNSLLAFKKFLQLTESRAGLLPKWWSKEKAAECIALGMSDGWASLRFGPEKSDMIEQYGNPQMPMQMRMFGEEIYGRGPGGQDGKSMLMMMVATEGGSLHSSTIDASAMLRNAKGA